MAIKEEIGDRRGVAASLNSIAQILDIEGKTEEAWASYRRSIEIRRDLRDREGVGIVLISLGVSYLEAERYDDALNTVKEALQIQRDLGHQDRQARCLSILGNVHFAKGEYETAGTYLDRALELREKGKVGGNIALTLGASAECRRVRRLRHGSTALSARHRALADQRRPPGAALGSQGLAVVFEQRGRYRAAMRQAANR